MNKYMSNEIVKFCAEEVERQHRGPVQVAWMVEAWDYALSRTGLPESYRIPTLEEIMMLGKLVEHEVNTGISWRNCNVGVGDHIAPQHRELSELMDRWYSVIPRSRGQNTGMTPEEAYKEFELIHPFQDGNGRVGKIIYNWLRFYDGLIHPVLPPNFFGGTV